jgi:hypothetical protein
MFEHNWKSTRNINYNHITDYDFTYIPCCSLSPWVKEEEEKLLNIHIEKQNNIDNNFETFTIEKTSSNI